MVHIERAVLSSGTTAFTAGNPDRDKHKGRASP
jgi:hypothetical protein